jgi:hypothetical protein
MKHTPKIGAYVLETLTTGMYTNPLDSLREYVQNAADAILSAERYKFIKPNAGIIKVTVDPSSRSLIIRDNGTGITSADAVQKLLNIGMSGKVYGQDAGFRGIGRLAGIAYCKRLVFSTTYPHEDEATKISFNCEEIKHSISPAMRKVEELSEVLERHTSQDLLDAKKDDHYFEVRLEEIDKNQPLFGDMQALEEYLGQVAPVQYDSQRFLFAPKIEQWLRDKNISLPTVKLLLAQPDGQREVFKLYKNNYKTRKKDFNFSIKDVRLLPEEFNEASTYWMWYAETDLLGMYDDERVAGLRFRRNNIAIGGPERVAQLFPGNEGRLNYWTMGEIHVLSDDVIPNARRDGFEATPEWLSLVQSLDPFIKDHCKTCHDNSSGANRPIAKVVASAKSTVEAAKSALHVGLSSPEDREAVSASLDKEIGRIEAAYKMDTPSAEQRSLNSVLTSLKTVKAKIEGDGSLLVERLRPNLDRKQRKIIIDILGIIESSLASVKCSKSKECIHAIKAAIQEKY